MTEVSELGVAVAHARHVPAADRQRWRVEVEAQGTSGAVVVATCHRVEVLATVDRLDRLPPLNGTERLDGRGAIRHVVALAVGLESLVVGEDQVLHQLREAVGAARASAALPAELDRLADVSLRAGRLARSWRTGPSRSLADVALDRIAGPSALTGRTVAIVGAGEMGRLAARAARQRGARIVVASRRTDSAERLAREEISRMTEHLAERLMREPLTRLGHDVDGRHEAAARELFGL